MGSIVPSALDALVALLKAAPALSGVQIFDGPEAQWPEGEFVAIGLSPDDLEITATRTPSSPITTAEVADIIGMTRSWTGDVEIKPRRDRAYELLDAVVASIDADRRLGGAVCVAQVVDSIYAPSQTRQGVVVDVVFTVRVENF